MKTGNFFVVILGEDSCLEAAQVSVRLSVLNDTPLRECLSCWFVFETVFFHMDVQGWVFYLLVWTEMCQLYAFFFFFFMCVSIIQFRMLVFRQALSFSCYVINLITFI